MGLGQYSNTPLLQSSIPFDTRDGPKEYGKQKVADSKLRRGE